MLSLSLPQSSATPFGVPPQRLPRLRVHGRDCPDRDEVEHFIHGIYRERYGADLRRFAPVLVSLRDADGALTAAIGYRAADEEALFLERYLHAPVEQLLADDTGAVPRARIVEVGHLAAGRSGEGRRLITLMGPHLAAQGFHWVVSTLTEELRHLFLRLGIAPLALGVADPAALGADAAGWGSYYDHHPVVLAGQIEPALQRLQRSRTAP